MNQYYKFDAEGYYLEPVIADYNEENPMPKDITDVRPPDGLYRGRFVNGKWIEAAPAPKFNADTEIALWDCVTKTWSIAPKPPASSRLSLDERVLALEDAMQKLTAQLSKK